MIKSIIGWISFLWFLEVALWEWFVVNDYQELDGDISHEGIQSLESAHEFAKGYKPTDE